MTPAMWAYNGGNPALYGDATPAEQNAVFAEAMQKGEENAWAPYDGC